MRAPRALQRLTAKIICRPWLLTALIAIALSLTLNAPVARADEPVPDPTGSFQTTPTPLSVPGYTKLSATRPTPRAATTEDIAVAMDQTAAAVDAVAQSSSRNFFAVNYVWTLVAGFLVMFMQAGFALVEAGLCRAKNA